MANLLAAIQGSRPRMTAEQRRRTAVHEAGHAVLAVRLGIGTRVSLGFDPAGGGVTEVDTPGPTGFDTEAVIDAHLAFILAGRAAEELRFGEAAAGCGGSGGSDLAVATDIAVQAEGRLGYGQDLPLVYLGGQSPRLDLAQVPWLCQAVAARLARAFARAKGILAESQAELVDLADALLEKEHLEDTEVRCIVEPSLQERRTA